MHGTPGLADKVINEVINEVKEWTFQYLNYDPKDLGLAGTEFLILMYNSAVFTEHTLLEMRNFLLLLATTPRSPALQRRARLLLQLFLLTLLLLLLPKLSLGLRVLTDYEGCYC
jgi:hypothetical protein